MVRTSPPMLGGSRSDRRFLRLRREVLRVPGVKLGTYSLVTDLDGSRWLYARRRSAPDARGRCEVLLRPEPSWAIAAAALLMARNGRAHGVRVEDMSTARLYEVTLVAFQVLSEEVHHSGYESQRRLPLRLWRVRSNGRPVSRSAVVQLDLFPPGTP